VAVMDWRDENIVWIGMYAAILGARSTESVCIAIDMGRVL